MTRARCILFERRKQRAIYKPAITRRRLFTFNCSKRLNVLLPSPFYSISVYSHFEIAKKSPRGIDGIFALYPYNACQRKWSGEGRKFENAGCSRQRGEQSSSKKTYFITIGSLFTSPRPATISPPWINHYPIPDFCPETSRALPQVVPRRFSKTIFYSKRAAYARLYRCVHLFSSLGVSKILGALFLPIGCIHRWIERGTAGREPNCVEITWNSFEFLQLVKGKESMIWNFAE